LSQQHLVLVLIVACRGSDQVTMATFSLLIGRSSLVLAQIAAYAGWHFQSQQDDFFHVMFRIIEVSSITWFGFSEAGHLPVARRRYANTMQPSPC